MDRSIRMQAGSTGVLLIHGLGGTPLELKSVAGGLHRAGFTVHACQLDGHCGSEADLAATTWGNWYASVEAAYRELQASCAEVIVGGLSMGALLALHLAQNLAQSPQVRIRGLLLLAPTLYYDGWAVRNQRWLMKLLGPLISTPIGRRYRFVEREPYGVKDERMRAIIRAALSSGDSSRAGVEGTPAVSLRELWRLAAVVGARLGEVSVPALIIHPREDDVSSLRNVHDLQAGLGGLVETLVLNDSYHLITLDRQRALVVERCVDFVRRREAGVARTPKLREVHRA